MRSVRFSLSWLFSFHATVNENGVATTTSGVERERHVSDELTAGDWESPTQRAAEFGQAGFRHYFSRGKYGYV
jgi:hypothetical protein